jgi:hypothetical protein
MNENTDEPIATTTRVPPVEDDEPIVTTTRVPPTGAQ